MSLLPRIFLVRSPTQRQTRSNALATRLNKLYTESMASQRIMSFTKLALAQFVETYGVLKEQRGFEGPSADELFEMLAEEIIGEPLTLKQCKARDDEVVQTAKAMEMLVAFQWKRMTRKHLMMKNQAAPVVEEAPTPKAVEQANQAPTRRV